MSVPLQDERTPIGVTDAFGDPLGPISLYSRARTQVAGVVSGAFRPGVRAGAGERSHGGRRRWDSRQRPASRSSSRASELPADRGREPARGGRFELDATSYLVLASRRARPGTPASFSRLRKKPRLCLGPEPLPQIPGRIVPREVRSTACNLLERPAHRAASLPSPRRGPRSGSRRLTWQCTRSVAERGLRRGVAIDATRAARSAGRAFGDRTPPSSGSSAVDCGALEVKGSGESGLGVAACGFGLWARASSSPCPSSRSRGRRSSGSPHFRRASVVGCPPDGASARRRQAGGPKLGAVSRARVLC